MPEQNLTEKALVSTCTPNESVRSNVCAGTLSSSIGASPLYIQTTTRYSVLARTPHTHVITENLPAIVSRFNRNSQHQQAPIGMHLRGPEIRDYQTVITLVLPSVYEYSCTGIVNRERPA